MYDCGASMPRLTVKVTGSLLEKVPLSGVIVSHVLLSVPARQSICPPPELVRVIVLCEVVPGKPAPKSICIADNCNSDRVDGCTLAAP